MKPPPRHSLEDGRQRLSSRLAIGYAAVMPLLLVTLMGVANFYLHRAVMDGREPAFVEIAAAIRRIGGRYGSYVLEFLILLAALWFAKTGETAAIVYGGYSAINWCGYHALRNMRS